MRTRARASIAIACLCLASAAPAQLAPIGLSEVGGQWFVNGDLLGNGPAHDHFGQAVAAGDFNGDGADDLATGAPGDQGLGCADCYRVGSVVVRWGAVGAGLATGSTPTVLHQGLSGSPDPPNGEDIFGAALAAGDFNGDGFDDLAVGIPGDSGYGAVQVYYGWSTGFQTEHSEYITEPETGEVDHVCSGSYFGRTLAAGNFDQDPYEDLAIGVPFGCERIDDELVRGGSVYVAHGQSWGLLPWYGYRISQDEVDIYDSVDPGDLFGWALATGDFDADSYDDLAIGVPGENGHGAVQILMGSQWGLLFWRSVFWLPGALGELPEDGDFLGSSLAAGDFDCDLHDDLAIGSPHEDSFDIDPSHGEPDVGRVAVAFGSPGDFDLTRTQRFGSLQVNDRFGWALADGDFDRDGCSDLAVGHLFKPEVRVLMGAPGSGLGARDRVLAPGIHGIPGPVDTTSYGQALASGDFDGNGHADLAIGAPNFSPNFPSNETLWTGGEAVLYGALFADGFELGSAGRWSGVQN